MKPLHLHQEPPIDRVVPPEAEPPLMDGCGTRAPTKRSMMGLRRRSGEEQVQRKGKGYGDGTKAHAPAVRRTQKKISILHSLFLLLLHS
ncbi:hypothetical protein F2Q69_00045650 [Brassica cretica]|uniref:Uncharacterized protein n=1 Tax=Brassica cretica TaxID=69181 RepID=A0A8S9NH20_BRACR|nr:hypothetical protein F2Q69_00045650 [Brassica cretica]